MKPTLFKRSALALAVASGLASLPVASQLLDEVVVTATKRPVGMQDVPISLSVMDGERISEQGINSLEDLSAYAPNVHIAESGSGDSLFIRGIGSGINYGFEQSVGTFIDGVYFGRGQASRSTFLDVERVEILKGSQSTLFGKNTIAGAINITTAKPTEDFEGSVELSAEPEFGGQKGTLMLSGPLTETLGARLVLTDQSEDGWVENGFTGDDETARDSQVGRITLAWQPSDNFDLGFKYEAGESETEGSNDVLSIVTPQAATYYTSVDANFAQHSGFGYDKSAATLGSPRAGNVYHNSDWDIYTLTANWMLGEHKLTSITGYVDYQFDNYRDSDYSPIQALARGRDESHKQFTQEFIVTSPQSDSFEYMAGLYYQDEALEHDRYTDVVLSNFAAVGVPFASPAVGVGAFDATAQDSFNQDSETLSAFFEGTFHFNDAVRLIAGIRYSEDQKEFDKTSDINNLFVDVTSSSVAAAGPSNELLAAIYDGTLNFITVHQFQDGQATVCNANGITTVSCVNSAIDTKRKEDHWTGDITVQWDLNDDTMLYGKIGNGYKAGGFDEDNSRGNVAAQEYDDETSETIEVGAKMNMWDGRGRFNVALFHSEYQDVQVSTFDGNAGFIVGNAAESEVDGIEMDGSFAATEELTFFASLALLDANYESFEDAPCTVDQTTAWVSAGNPRSSCTNDLSGEPLQFAADVSANLGVSYIAAISDNLELGLGADVFYSDEFDTATDGDENLQQDAYTKVNARISLSDLDGVWSLALLGKNLTDETTSSWGNDVPLGRLGFDGTYFQLMDAPRSVEIQAKYNF